jgi:type I site-specific restriction-modification system R (restriction) subunit
MISVCYSEGDYVGKKQNEGSKKQPKNAGSDPIGTLKAEGFKTVNPGAEQSKPAAADLIGALEAQKSKAANSGTENVIQGDETENLAGRIKEMVDEELKKEDERKEYCQQTQTKEIKELIEADFAPSKAALKDFHEKLTYADGQSKYLLDALGHEHLKPKEVSRVSNELKNKLETLDLGISTYNNISQVLNELEESVLNSPEDVPKNLGMLDSLNSDLSSLSHELKLKNIANASDSANILSARLDTLGESILHPYVEDPSELSDDKGNLIETINERIEILNGIKNGLNDESKKKVEEAIKNVKSLIEESNLHANKDKPNPEIEKLDVLRLSTEDVLLEDVLLKNMPPEA